MKKLKFYPASNIDKMASPEEARHYSPETSALDFFTDFNEIKPLVIESSMPAVAVGELMIKSHVRLKLVISKDYKFLGVISTDDLIDRKIMQKLSKGDRREEILVAEMMRSKSDLVALDFAELATATISDVIDVLKDSGTQHCLVVDRSDNCIRGIFSASDISRKLHLSINIQDKSSFFKVFSAIY
jgi:CBS domain-containing protein